MKIEPCSRAKLCVSISAGYRRGQQGSHWSHSLQEMSMRIIGINQQTESNLSPGPEQIHAGALGNCSCPV